ETKNEYKKIIWLQSYSDTHFFAHQKQLAVHDKILKIVREAFPQLYRSDSKILRNLKKLLKKLKEKKKFEQQALSLQKDLNKNEPWSKFLDQLENRIDAYLSGYDAKAITGELNPQKSDP